jgi:streptogramin lyase
MKRNRAFFLHAFIVLFIALDGTLLVRAAHPVSALTPISEFTLPTPERFPLGITTGPDDNFWFVEYASGTIGRMTPTGMLTEFPVASATSSTYLRSIAAGPDNNLWFTDTGNNRIGRMTPTGSSTLFPIPTPASNPEGIAAGSDGNMWFTEYNGNAIGRITSAGIITEFALPPTSNHGLGGIAAGSDGNMWFADTGNNRIGRITPSGQTSFFVIPTPYSQPLGITAGPDGNLWFTEGSPSPTDHHDHIGRITPAGVITEFPLPSQGSGPYGITTGSDGNLWFTEQSGKIGRITPDGNVSEYAIPTTPSTPQGFAITAGPGGTLWFTEFQGNRIGRLRLADVPTDSPTSTPTVTQPSPVNPTPLPLRDCTVSIDAGALFTEKLAIRVQAEVQNAVWMAISNDGGFSGAIWQPYRPSVPWTVRDPGARIATLLVYTRFQDAQGHVLCGGSTLSDDIIYDPLSPTVKITLMGAEQRVEGQSQPHGVTRLTTTRLLLTADDQVGGSGVAEMRLGFDQTFGDVVWQPFQPIIQVPVRSGHLIYMQARDQIGNVSAITSIRFPYTVYLALTSQ